MRDGLAALLVLGAVGTSLIACSDAWAQPERPTLAKITAQAKRDPQGALQALRSLLTRTDLKSRVRLRALHLRARLLTRTKRRVEAERAWRQLLARGEDVQRDLLELVGAKLKVEAPRDLVPGRPAKLELRGSGTGPLTLRLYRLDARRWRLAADRDRTRGLFAHLRAPTPGALRKVAQWQLPGFSPGEGSRPVPTPAPLRGGIYLLTIAFRQVVLPFPLVVSRTLALVRRGSGPGVVFLVDRHTGRPRGGVTLRAYGAEGFVSKPLGATGEQGRGQGLLRYETHLPWAAGWVGDELLLIPLLRSTPPAASTRRPLATDLPYYTPGQPLHALAFGLPRSGRATTLQVVDPTGLPVRSVTLRGGRSGTGRTTVRVPRAARPGIWQLALGRQRQPLRVVQPARQVELRLTCARKGKQLLATAQATLPNGYPLSGHRLRWRLRGLPARFAWSNAAPRPHPARALRRALGVERNLGEGTVALDRAGQARWAVATPALSDPELLRLEASLAEGSPRARAWTDLDAAPRDVWLRVLPDVEVAAPGELVGVTITATRTDGRPANRRDVAFEVYAAGARVERRVLRTRGDGTARTILGLDRHGALRLKVSTGEARAESTLWLADQTSRLSPRAPRLLLRRTKLGQLRGLGLLPGGDRVALLTREGVTIDAARVVLLKGGVLRWNPAPVESPGRRFTLSAVHAGKLLHAATDWRVVPGRLPLSLAGPVVGRRGAEATLAAQTGPPNAPRPARLLAILYEARTARLLDRAEGLGAARSRPVASGVRGGLAGELRRPSPSGKRAARAGLPQSLRTVASWDAGWSDAAGKGTLRLRLPARAGEYWLRVQAVDAQGRRGRAWCQVRVVAPLRAQLFAPEWLIEEDGSRVVARITAEAARENAVLRVSWRAKGVALGTPRIVGTKALLKGDPGPATLRLKAAPRVRLEFPLSATGPGDAHLSLRVGLEGTKRSEALERRLRVHPRGLVERRFFSGRATPKRAAHFKLTVPKGAVPALNTLTVALDPLAATAALAGLQALERTGVGLRAALQAALARRLLRPLLARQKLSPPTFGQGRPWSDLLEELATRRSPQGGWGAETPSITLALVRLRALNHPVPRTLLRGALQRLRRSHPHDPRARLALALAGRPAPPAGGVETAAGRLFAALARDRLPDDPAGLAKSLRSIEGQAELFQWLLRKTAQPLLRQALLTRILRARRGPDWGDPDDTGAAVRALTAQAGLEAERAGTRARVFLEGAKVHTAWSGAGLTQWRGVGSLRGSRVGTGARLRVRVRGKDPVWFSGSVTARVRRRLPAPLRQGLQLERRLLGRTNTPIASTAVGNLVRLRLTWRALDGRPLRGVRLEVPLPGACRLLDPPPGAVVREGILLWEPTRPSLDLSLLPSLPGTYRLLPARLRSLRDLDRRATTAEATLRVE